MGFFNKNKNNNSDTSKQSGAITNSNSGEETSVWDRVNNARQTANQQKFDNNQKKMNKANAYPSFAERHSDHVPDFEIANAIIENSINDGEAQKNIAKTERVSQNSNAQQNTAVVSKSVRLMYDANSEKEIRSVVGLSTHIGKRSSQQDAAAVTDNSVKGFGNERWMAVLCDGMGGMNGGEIASSVCVEGMMNSFSAIGTKPIPSFFIESIVEIDDRVASLRDENGEYLSAGSTLISVVIEGDKLYWGSVGDSHIYIIRNVEMMRVNEEHNYYADLLEMVKAGKMTLAEADNNKNKEALTSYMGIGGITKMDVIQKPFNLMPNDCIILCSDGLYRSVSENEMFRIVINNLNDMQKAADELVQCALSKNKRYQDNTTVVVIRYVKK